MMKRRRSCISGLFFVILKIVQCYTYTKCSNIFQKRWSPFFESRKKVIQRNAEASGKKFPTIQELMKATEDRLREGKLNAEEINYEKNDGSKKTDTTGSSSLTTSSAKVVAVVLGKALCDGRISIEHASRISALVRALKKTPLKPSLVVFASAIHTKNDISMLPSHTVDDAPSAAAYFYHLCESRGVKPPRAEQVWLSAPLTTRDAMRRFLSRVKSVTGERNNGEISGPGKEYHILVFAADYVTRRLDRVYRISPRLSLLTTVAQGGESFSFEAVSYPPGGLILEPADAFLARLHVLIDSLVPLLINLHAVVNKEEILAKEYYDDLVDAKNTIAKQIEFIQSPLRPAALRLQTSASLTARQLLSSTNYHDQNEENFYDNNDDHNTKDKSSSIAAHTSGTQRIKVGRRRDAVRARAAATSHSEVPRRQKNSPLLDEALESVLSLLNELERLIRPGALRTDSLTVEEWRKALRLLQRAMHQARLATDPDRPLAVADWGRLVDRDPVPVFDTDLADAGWTQGWTEWNVDPESPLVDVSTLYRPPGGLMPFDDLKP